MFFLLRDWRQTINSPLVPKRLNTTVQNQIKGEEHSAFTDKKKISIEEPKNKTLKQDNLISNVSLQASVTQCESSSCAATS